jgi:arginase
MKTVAIDAGFAIGGADTGNRNGPWLYRRSRLRYRHGMLDGGLVWQCQAQPLPWPEGVPELRNSCVRLARRVLRQQKRGLPVIIGGDHSCAIGTWSGLSVYGQKALGLLWIDAHLDSHTPLTSPSGRLHGMPLAILLGEGEPALQLGQGPMVRPEYTVVLGVRSYEPGEPERLQRLGVRFYAMDEIRRRGLGVCVAEAWKRVSAAPDGFGLSIDLDALDPAYAPAVSVREPDGLSLPHLVKALHSRNRRRLKAVEIVEFNPTLDRDLRTQKTLTALLNCLLR